MYHAQLGKTFGYVRPSPQFNKHKLSRVLLCFLLKYALSFFLSCSCVQRCATLFQGIHSTWHVRETGYPPERCFIIYICIRRLFSYLVLIGSFCIGCLFKSHSRSCPGFLLVFYVSLYYWYCFPLWLVLCCAFRTPARWRCFFVLYGTFVKRKRAAETEKASLDK